MKSTLSDIKRMVEVIASKINTPGHLLPTFGNWTESHPNIEIDSNGQLHYEVYERGEQIRNDFALDENDLCYRVFTDITFSMALEYEARNRIKELDFRRILFSKQEELLGELQEEWKLRKQKEHAEILRPSPFQDS
jgi:hypothetical protein